MGVDPGLSHTTYEFFLRFNPTYYYFILPAPYLFRALYILKVGRVMKSACKSATIKLYSSTFPYLSHSSIHPFSSIPANP